MNLFTRFNQWSVEGGKFNTCYYLHICTFLELFSQNNNIIQTKAKNTKCASVWHQANEQANDLLLREPWKVIAIPRQNTIDTYTALPDTVPTPSEQWMQNLSDMVGTDNLLWDPIPAVDVSIVNDRLQCTLHCLLCWQPPACSQAVLDFSTHENTSTTSQWQSLIGWLVGWGLTALWAQMGHIVPLISTLQLKKVKLLGESWQCYVLGIHTLQ